MRSGSGIVRSTPAGIECGGTCSAAFDPGTSIALVAVADPGWTFAGWGGACNATIPNSPGTCSLALAADSTVSATFQAVGSQTDSRHRLDVSRSGEGKGRITSNPGDIDCGTGCSAIFPDGTHVGLAATPEPGSKFAGWGGACSGSSGCTLTISGDTSATATFSLLPPTDECAGLRPTTPGAPSHSHSKAVNTSSGNDGCVAGMSDGNGTLALFLTSSHGEALIDFVSSSGGLMTTGQGSNLFPLTDQLSGFIGLNFAGGGTWWLTAWDSSGHETTHQFLEQGFRGTGIAQDPLGGVVDNAGQSYDEQLRLRWSVPVSASAVGVDRAGRTLFLFDGTSRYGANSVAAEWVDHDGTAGAVFQWFGPRPGVFGFSLEPRVGDGFFIATGGRWTAQIESLATGTTPAPAWLQARPDASLHMVHGGRGYAVLPAVGSDSATCSQAVEVIAPSGTSCGTVSFGGGTGLCKMKAITVGYNGTVIQQLPAVREQQCWFGPCTCTWQWWSGFFK